MPELPVDRTVRAAQVEWWDIVAAVEAAEDYVARCGRCHRELRSERSIRAGIGPRCAAQEAATGQRRIEDAHGYH